MTTDSRISIDTPGSWLEDGPVQLADPVLDATLAAVHPPPRSNASPSGGSHVLHIAAADRRGSRRPVVTGGAIGLAVFRLERGGPPAIARRRPRAVGRRVARRRAPRRRRPCSSIPTPTSSRWTRATRTPAGTVRPAGSSRRSRAAERASSSRSPSTATSDMPAWSPDGARIAFVPRARGSTGLWTAASDGSGATRWRPARAPCTSIDYPAWSPDGKRIVFTETDIPQDAARPTAARLVVLTLKGGERTVVAEGGPDALPDRAELEPGRRAPGVRPGRARRGRQPDRFLALDHRRRRLGRDADPRPGGERRRAEPGPPQTSSRSTTA